MKNKLLIAALLLALIPLVAFGHPGFWNGSWGNHMGFSDGNWNNHMGFIGGGWMMILWMALFVLFAYAIVKWATARKNVPVATNDALSILSERYARGEISEDEFQSMKKTLLS